MSGILKPCTEKRSEEERMTWREGRRRAFSFSFTKKGERTGGRGGEGESIGTNSQRGKRKEKMDGGGKSIDEPLTEERIRDGFSRQ